MFKYGTFIPKSDREAEQSPEAQRWRSGRSLEWLRLRQANSFETDWTWDRIRREHPEYRKEDIGHMFMFTIINISGSTAYDWSLMGPDRVSLPTVSLMHPRCMHNQSECFICTRSNMDGIYSNMMFLKLFYDRTQTVRFLYTHLRDSQIILANY